MNERLKQYQTERVNLYRRWYKQEIKAFDFINLYPEEILTPEQIDKAYTIYTNADTEKHVWIEVSYRIKDEKEFFDMAFLSDPENIIQSDDLCFYVVKKITENISLKEKYVLTAKCDFVTVMEEKPVTKVAGFCAEMIAQFNKRKEEAKEERTITERIDG